MFLFIIVVRHGYGRWQAIVDDKDLKIQEVICQELNLPFLNFPVAGQVGSELPNVINLTSAEAPNNQSKENGSDLAADNAHGAGDARNQAYQEISIFNRFRDMQRRQVDFIKKRVLLLEKGLNGEYQKEYFVCSYASWCINYFLYSDSFSLECLGLKCKMLVDQKLSYKITR